MEQNRLRQTSGLAAGLANLDQVFAGLRFFQIREFAQQHHLDLLLAFVFQSFTVTVLPPLPRAAPQ